MAFIAIFAAINYVVFSYLKIDIPLAAGLGFNVIFDPIIGYLFKRFILGINAEAAAIILTWTGGVTAFNAVICVFVSVALYMTLRKPFASIYGRKDS